MAVSEGDLAFLLDQLAGLGELRSRRMFSGIGLYSVSRTRGDRFFALMYHGAVFFKADDQTRARYTTRRLKPFQPPGYPPSTNYYTVPATVLEDADELLVWAREAIEAAGRKAAAKKAPKTSAKATARKTVRKTVRKSR